VEDSAGLEGKWDFISPAELRVGIATISLGGGLFTDLGASINF
jgi:hypothetical protein